VQSRQSRQNIGFHCAIRKIILPTQRKDGQVFEAVLCLVSTYNLLHPIPREGVTSKSVCMVYNTSPCYIRLYQFVVEKERERTTCRTSTRSTYTFIYAYKVYSKYICIFVYVLYMPLHSTYIHRHTYILSRHFDISHLRKKYTFLSHG